MLLTLKVCLGVEEGAAGGWSAELATQAEATFGQTVRMSQPYSGISSQFFLYYGAAMAYRNTFCPVLELVMCCLGDPVFLVQSNVQSAL